ncbi:lytic murein transglycosylase B [Imhoffiella purpurea]|uniref:Membrane-bound lytic murein transglycosylase B n=1 Tax=Imhoffiella purpurea TaxID=1249627 RepID=W9VFU3_9GAMM|nr:lytic murein transglycosylase B [Imhoffiella purpurea]EXJ15861.1 Membrane-bound lytic murein transglycosylase B precursor [Imhoffiella purpurea]
MRPLSLSLLVLWSLALAGCGSQPARDGAPVYRPASYQSASVHGDFAGAPGVDDFIQRMARQHGFSPRQTASILSRAQRRQPIIDLMDRQAPSRRSTGPNGAWTRYRAKFLTDSSIANGVSFWRRHESALARAQAHYGVPAEYIVAIIGVETRYGGFVGKTRILDALATLSFAYPRRADYFSGELEHFLVMTRDEGMDPTRPEGSFAGAMGLCQFMPSSFRDYAVDFTGDGHRNLWHPEDAIGSVANYFKRHGWRSGEAVAVRARISSGSSAGVMKTGYDTQYGLGQLAARGIEPAGSLSGARQVSLLRLDAQGGYEYWLGLHNFYVITRYNHSAYYAMAVHQLAQAIRTRHGGTPGVRLSSLW